MVDKYTWKSRECVAVEEFLPIRRRYSSWKNDFCFIKMIVNNTLNNVKYIYIKLEKSRRKEDDIIN